MIQEAGGGHDEFWARMSWRKVGLDIEKMYQEAGTIEVEYHALANADPLSAVNNFPAFINRISEISPCKVAMCAGTNPEWTGPVLSAMGIWYSSLYPETKKLALSKALNFLDQQNYFLSQENVSHIDNPHLASDIVVSEPAYWPGFNQYLDVLSSSRAWEEVRPKYENAQSVFWLSYAITFPEFASDGVRDGLEKEHPSLLDGTLNAVASINYESAVRKNKRDGVAITDSLEKSLAKHDARYSSRVNKKIEERNWIVLDRNTRLNRTS